MSKEFSVSDYYDEGKRFLGSREGTEENIAYVVECIVASRPDLAAPMLERAGYSVVAIDDSIDHFLAAA